MPNMKNRILVDADSCPVKDEILTIAKEFNVQVIFVASYAHVMTNEKKGTWVMVDKRQQEVDLYIVNHLQKNDVVVTQDFGLASLIIRKGAYALSPRGKQFIEETMDTILYERFLSMKLRKQGARVKGVPPFSKEDRQKFCKTIRKILSTIEGI